MLSGLSSPMISLLSLCLSALLMIVLSRGNFISLQIWIARRSCIASCPHSVCLCILGIYSQVNAGFGDNVYALNLAGQGFKRSAVSARIPIGTKWIRMKNTNMKLIQGSLGGVYAVNKNGYMAFFNGMFLTSQSVCHNFCILSLIL